MSTNQNPSVGTHAGTIQAPSGSFIEEGNLAERLFSGAFRLPVESHMPSFDGATAWLNSQPLTPSGLRGKVVVVNFCTYTCINWLRTLPYVRAWAKKYSDKGLVVVGVHTPEFSFEHDLDNVRMALKALDVEYPVPIDNDYTIWTSFSNHYWPALYFVDAQGRIRHHQFGEGKYAESEMVIQQLLTEAGVEDISRDLVTPDARGIEVAADWDDLQSSENYLGYDRTEGFASPSGTAYDRRGTYSVPARLSLNEWALSGDWTVTAPAIALNTAGGRIAYRFHARDLHLVMGPATRGSSVRFRVYLDGEPAGYAHGADLDEQGTGTVTEQRTYQLIRQPAPITDRQFEIEFLDKGVEAFAFTFG